MARAAAPPARDADSRQSEDDDEGIDLASFLPPSSVPITLRPGETLADRIPEPRASSGPWQTLSVADFAAEDFTS